MARQRKPIIISLFSGALGLDLGLEEAGFETRVAVECNPIAAQTIRLNRPDIHVIEKRIEEVSSEEIRIAARIAVDDIVVVTGGPACQAFSTAGARKSFVDPRGQLFGEFVRVVNDIKPDYFVMENVRGLLSAAQKHRPLNKRGPGFPALEPEEQLGSAFAHIVSEIKDLGYCTVVDLFNSADFGVPQTRQRVIFIGAKNGRIVPGLAKTHSKDGANLPGWKTLGDAIANLNDPDPEFNKITPKQSKYIKLIPAGGNWRDLPDELQEEALGAAYVSWGGRSGFCRRLSLDKPSPSVTTQPDNKATCLFHPTELRVLSIREYMRIQQFPDDWQFAGKTSQKYLQIGNAVPIGLGEAIGKAILCAIKSPATVHTGPLVVCTNPSLVKSLKKLPLTKMNPRRMRENGSDEADRAWMDGLSTNRIALLESLSLGLPKQLELDVAS